jgi:RNA-binding protein
MKQLTPEERRQLKGLAHRLDPVVTIGAAGLTAAVAAEVRKALQAHQLIKIRVSGRDRAQRDMLLAEICAAADASAVQHIGNVLVVYRERYE